MSRDSKSKVLTFRPDSLNCFLRIKNSISPERLLPGLTSRVIYILSFL